MTSPKCLCPWAALAVIIAAVVGLAGRRWGDRAGQGLSIIALYFWPTLLFVATCLWPKMTWRRRMAVCGVGGAVLLAVFWGYAWATDDLAWANMAFLMGIFFAWPLQAAVIGLVRLAWIWAGWLADEP